MDVKLSFSAEEAELLEKILRDNLEETRLEARRTDNTEYKSHVMQREEIMKRMHERLCQAIGLTPSAGVGM